MRQGNVTTITTIASEYTSDLVVGLMNLFFSLSFAFVDKARSSGAHQRGELLDIEGLAKNPFLVVDDSPKSVRRGFPVGSIRMFDCVSNSAGWKVEGSGNLHSLDSRELHPWSASN